MKRGRRGGGGGNVAGGVGRRRAGDGRALRRGPLPRAVRGGDERPGGGVRGVAGRDARHAQAESTRGGVPSGVEAHLRQHAQRVHPEHGGREVRQRAPARERERDAHHPPHSQELRERADGRTRKAQRIRPTRGDHPEARTRARGRRRDRAHVARHARQRVNRRSTRGRRREEERSGTDARYTPIHRGAAARCPPSVEHARFGNVESGWERRDPSNGERHIFLFSGRHARATRLRPSRRQSSTSPTRASTFHAARADARRTRREANPRAPARSRSQRTARRAPAYGRKSSRTSTPRADERTERDGGGSRAGQAGAFATLAQRDPSLGARRPPSGRGPGGFFSF